MAAFSDFFLLLLLIGLGGLARGVRLVVRDGSSFFVGELCFCYFAGLDLGGY